MQQMLDVHWILITTEPIVNFQPVVVHTPEQMLLQGQIQGVSAQRLAGG